jgi:hypothetical protein
MTPAACLASAGQGGGAMAEKPKTIAELTDEDVHGDRTVRAIENVGAQLRAIKKVMIAWIVVSVTLQLFSYTIYELFRTSAHGP